MMFASQSTQWLAAVEHVCHHMRLEEQVQHLAFMADTETERPDYNPRAAAASFLAADGLGAFYCNDQGKPVLCGGWQPTLPGVWSSWMVGTDEAWESYWRDVTKGTRWTMDKLMQGGARRLETCVLASRTAAWEWFERHLGMQREGVRREYTPAGEDVFLYSYTRSDWVARLGDDDGQRSR